MSHLVVSKDILLPDKGVEELDEGALGVLVELLQVTRVDVQAVCGAPSKIVNGLLNH